MLRATLIWSIVAFTLLCSVDLFAQEAEGKKLEMTDEDNQRAEEIFIEKKCQECHGVKGRDAIKNYPNLAGQSETYLITQIKDIISGARVGSDDEPGHPRTANMKESLLDEEGNPIITDEEIALISRWLNNLKPVEVARTDGGLSEERYEKGRQLYKDKRCDICHGRRGMRPKEGYPYVANQRKSYIEAQINDMKLKIRRNGHARRMSPFVKNITDEEISLLADYLSHTVLRKARKRLVPIAETEQTDNTEE